MFLALKFGESGFGMENVFSDSTLNSVEEDSVYQDFSGFKDIYRIKQSLLDSSVDSVTDGNKFEILTEPSRDF